MDIDLWQTRKCAPFMKKSQPNRRTFAVAISDFFKGKDLLKK